MLVLIAGIIKIYQYILHNFLPSSDFSHEPLLLFFQVLF